MADKTSPILEPLEFVSESKKFCEYKKDLKRWSLLTNVPKAKQALMVLHYLDGDPSGIKEKVDAEIEEDVLYTEQGIEALLQFFKKIYKRDSLADGYEKYLSFEKLKRSPNKSIQDFIPEFNTSYKKAINIGCSLSDSVGFQAIDCSQSVSIGEKFCSYWSQL